MPKIVETFNKDDLDSVVQHMSLYEGSDTESSADAALAAEVNASYGLSREGHSGADPTQTEGLRHRSQTATGLGWELERLRSAENAELRRQIEELRKAVGITGGPPAGDLNAAFRQVPAPPGEGEGAHLFVGRRTFVPGKVTVLCGHDGLARRVGGPGGGDAARP